MTSQNDVRNNSNYIPVLDKGFVGLVDTMGSDQAIIRAARTSYGEGTKTLREDRGLIRYLMRHKHTSPIEMCEVVFHIKLPIFVMRQLVRHRTASLNEYSARYSVMTDEYYIPAREQLQPQSKSNKQGRAGKISEHDKDLILTDIINISDNAYELYKDMLNENPVENRIPQEGEFDSDYPGVARELARMVLPVNYYTTLYWKIDLLNFFKTLKLRADSHAQWEIQEFARAMKTLAQPHFPMAFEAFEDYWENGVDFSRQEIDVLKNLLYVDSAIEKNNKLQEIIDLVGSEKEFAENNGMSLNEFNEFKKKLGL